MAQTENSINSKKLMEIAGKFKTPAYVYEEKKIRDNYSSTLKI